MRGAVALHLAVVAERNAPVNLELHVAVGEDEVLHAEVAERTVGFGGVGDKVAEVLRAGGPASTSLFRGFPVTPKGFSQGRQLRFLVGLAQP